MLGNIYCGDSGHAHGYMGIARRGKVRRTGVHRHEPNQENHQKATERELLVTTRRQTQSPTPQDMSLRATHETGSALPLGLIILKTPSTQDTLPATNTEVNGNN